MVKTNAATPPKRYTANIQSIRKKWKQQIFKRFVNPNRAFLAFRQSHTDCTIVSITVLTIIITHADWLPNYLKPIDCDSRPQTSKADVSSRLQRHSKLNCCSAWCRPGGQSIRADWYTWKPPGAWFQPGNMLETQNTSKLCFQWRTSFCCHADAITTIKMKDVIASRHESKVAALCLAHLVTWNQARGDQCHWLVSAEAAPLSFWRHISPHMCSWGWVSTDWVKCQVGTIYRWVLPAAAVSYWSSWVISIWLHIIPTRST